MLSKRKEASDKLLDGCDQIYRHGKARRDDRIESCLIIT